MPRRDTGRKWRSRLQRRPNRGTARSILYRGIAATCLLIAIVAPSDLVPALKYFVERFEYAGYDLLLAALPSRADSQDVVIVDVDEDSLRTLGQWPWPRDRVAELIGVIHESGADAIGIDFIFAEPDNLSLMAMASRIYSVAQVDVRDQLNSLARDTGIEIDNDHVLGRELARENVVTSVWFDDGDAVTEPTLELPVPQSVVRSSSRAPASPFPVARRGNLPHDKLLEQVDRVGFVNALHDRDGTIRRLPLLYAYGLQLIPALSLSTVMAARGFESIDVRIDDTGVRSVSIGDTRIPTDHQGNMLIPFRQPYGERFKKVSAQDVLNGGVDPSLFRDAIVLVGTTVTALKDTSPVPYARNMAGVQIHAIATAAILSQDFLHPPPYEFIATLLSILVAGGVATMLIARRSLTTCMVVIGGLLVAIWAVSVWLFVDQSVYVSPVPSFLTLLILSIVLGVTRIRGEEQRAMQGIQELALAQDCAILGLVSIAETRDPETGSHILRTQHYVRALAEVMAKHPEYKDKLNEEIVDTLYRSAPLHDVGKVGVPDNVLLKPGKLTDDEFAIMKLHTIHGHEVLTHAEQMSGIDAQTSFLRCAAEIAKSHHEKWDGSGYPDGLAGHDIPFSARLMALADVYDALRSKRHYKEAYSHEKTRGIIVNEAGAHFDPVVVSAFETAEEEFIRIAKRFSEVDGPASSLHDYPEHDAHPEAKTSGR